MTDSFGRGVQPFTSSPERRCPQSPPAAPTEAEKDPDMDREHTLFKLSGINLKIVKMKLLDSKATTLCNFIDYKDFPNDPVIKHLKLKRDVGTQIGEYLKCGTVVTTSGGDSRFAQIVHCHIGKA